MAIVRVKGKADYFITMTCNPKWPEISRELLEGYRAEDRPDIVARVFNQKVRALLEDIKKGVLGRLDAYTYTVEFQKRGLPHIHLLVWVVSEDKPTPETYDDYVAAELPDSASQPQLYETVVKSMVCLLFLNVFVVVSNKITIHYFSLLCRCMVHVVLSIPGPRA